MYNKNIKLFITILIIAYAGYQFYEGLIGNGIMYLLLSTIFIFFYFKNEFILLAFLKLRKQNFEGAKKWLDKIKNPSSALTTKQQGYFNYLNGIMVSQTNMNEAEKYFKIAISLGLSMDHDLAMAKLNLAGIAFSKRRRQEANKLLSEAQKLDKRNMLTDQIKMMKQQMKKAQMPNLHYGSPTSSRQNRRSRR
jgi:tetratricopeptide (TPR) repeat protein